MTFEQWLRARGETAATLTDDRRSELQAAYRQEFPQTTPQPAPTPAPAPATQPATQIQADGSGEPAAPSAPIDIRAHVDTAVGDALAAERQRVATIHAACEGIEGDDVADLQARALAGEIDVPTLQAGLLNAVRAARPAAPAIHVPTRELTAPILEAALCIAGGLEGAEAQYDDQTLQAAHDRYRGTIGLQEFLLTAAFANGYSGRWAIHAGNLREVLRAAFPATVNAAFSSFSLPGILSNVANKFLAEGFESVESTWKAIASTRPVHDFKAITVYRLTGDFLYEKVGPDGELKHATVGEESRTNQAATYGKMFSLTRVDIINDDLNALTVVRRRLGRGAGLAFNVVFWTEFLDNSAFFKTANKNYKSGATSALSVQGLTLAEQMFLDQVDGDGHPVGIKPRTLLVPTAKKTTGRRLMSSSKLVEGGGSSESDVPEDNPYAGAFELACSAYLSDSTISGYSAKAWYLLASPADEPVIEVVFLDGKETPTVEQADADFNTLGVQFRGYQDFGVKKAEHRAGVKMKGEA